jgi:hypothetical protein
MRFPFRREKTRKEIETFLSKFSDLYEIPIDLSHLSVDYIKSAKIPMIKTFDYAKILWKQNNIEIPISEGYIESEGKIDRIPSGTINLSGNLDIKTSYCTKPSSQKEVERELLKRVLGKKRGENTEKGNTESAIYILSVYEVIEHVAKVYVKTKEIEKKIYVNNRLRNTRTKIAWNWNDVLCSFLQGYDLDNLKHSYKLNEDESKALTIIRMLLDHSQGKPSICVLQSSDDLRTFSLKKPSSIYSNESPIEIKGDKIFVKFNQNSSNLDQKDSEQTIQKHLENCKIDLYPKNTLDFLPTIPIPALIKVGNRSGIPIENPRIIKYTREDELNRENFDKRTKMKRIQLGEAPYKELYIDVKDTDKYLMKAKKNYANMIANKVESGIVYLGGKIAYVGGFIRDALMIYSLAGIIAGWPLFSIPILNGFEVLYHTITSTPYNVQSSLITPLLISVEPWNLIGLLNDCALALGAYLFYSIYSEEPPTSGYRPVIYPRGIYSLKVKGSGLMKSSIISENSPFELEEILESYRYDKKEF